MSHKSDTLLALWRAAIYHGQTLTIDCTPHPVSGLCCLRVNGVPVLRVG